MSVVAEVLQWPSCIIGSLTHVALSLFKRQFGGVFPPALRFMEFCGRDKMKNSRPSNMLGNLWLIGIYQ